MREMTATEAARQFKAVLDAVESGETFAVTRRGTTIATIAPAQRANSAAFRQVVDRWRHATAIDDEFAAAVANARAATDIHADSDPWRD